MKNTQLMVQLTLADERNEEHRQFYGQNEVFLLWVLASHRLVEYGEAIEVILDECPVFSNIPVILAERAASEIMKMYDKDDLSKLVRMRSFAYQVFEEVDGMWIMVEECRRIWSAVRTCKRRRRS